MRYFKLLFLAVISIIAIGCEKPVVDNEQPLPEPEVTYEAMDGAWQLTEWRGEALSDQTFLYIAFDDETRRFEMWDNLGSMYTQHKTGSFYLSKDENDKVIISGQYDNGVGDWNKSYNALFTHKSGEYMAWTIDDENMLFKHIDQIPELN
mgnify:CR=1 FL=1